MSPIISSGLPLVRFINAESLTKSKERIANIPQTRSAATRDHAPPQDLLQVYADLPVAALTAKPRPKLTMSSTLCRPRRRKLSPFKQALSSRHQYCKNDRHEEERRHIPHQV